MNRNENTHTEPLIAEVRLFGFEPLPAGWRPCDGAELPIDDHQPLFALIGWRFGGDGWTTFALPDLRLETPSTLLQAIAIRGIVTRDGGKHE